MSTSQNIKRLIVHNNDAICTITMNRPEKRNALSRKLLGDLQVFDFPNLDRENDPHDVHCNLSFSGAR